MKKRIRNFLGRNFAKKKTTDRLSRKKRSLLMSKIRSKNTNFETKLFKELKRNKLKFRIHVKKILGNPDIVFFEKRLCVFLDSDFWHGWQYPRWKHLLKDNFWRKKIERNRQRDLNVSKYLRNNGWTVLRIWEHEMKNSSNKVIKIIQNRIRGRK